MAQKIRQLSKRTLERNLRYYKALASDFGHQNVVSKTGFDLTCLDCGLTMDLKALTDGNVLTCENYKNSQPSNVKAVK